jgi:hypothetical protein
MIGFVRDVIRVLGMPCREHTALFSRQLDEPLSAGMTVGLRIHLLYCAGCRKFKAQVGRLRELAGRMGQDLGGDGDNRLPATVRDRVLHGITESRTDLSQKK